ncbi:Sel1-like repeat-containing protein kinase family protein [Sulfurimonas sp. HSL3-2]|uniref:Sel1-like repeat-containing protein kinase family protein n=1 Tax=Hydrocurvibacter mobilis TaxID=3131936 RepID=UPI0031F97AF2
MADKSDTLGLRTQVEQYSIHDVEYVGDNTIIYRAEDMRVGREVWLREYFPSTIAKRHHKEGGQSTVYVHPTQSEVFAAGKTELQTLYNTLKGVNNPAIPAFYQTFEAGGTLYATTQYSGGMKTLRQLYDAKKIFSEQQISTFALSLVRALVILQRTGLQVRSLNPDTLLLNTATNECSTAYAEFVSFNEQRVQQLMHELAIVLYGMIDSENIEDDKPLKPLEPNSVYSGALCGLINRMVFEESSQRPKIFEELQTLLQSYQPSEAECEPIVCKKTDNPFSSLASMASIVLILVFAYYIFTQPKTLDIKKVTWFDAARYHLVAYFGNAQAESGLGQMYEKGYGVDRNIKEALFWYKKAAEQGNLYAQLSLAQIYHKGMGVNKNITEAIHWYEKAASNGDKQVKWQLAKIYMDQKAYDKAQRYYEELARDGDVQAQKNLAYMKVSGKRKKDPEGAFNIFLKLAKTGDLYAQQSLGYMFISGKGTSKDYAQALYWFKQAEKQGDGYSCGAIGEMYLYGLGVSKNKEEARYWFEKGLSRNDKYSKRALMKMGQDDTVIQKVRIKNNT